MNISGSMRISALEKLASGVGALRSLSMSRLAARPAGALKTLRPVPGTQFYATPSKLKRLRRQFRSAQREAAMRGVSVESVQASRNMENARAAALQRKMETGYSRNISALESNGFTHAGDTYSGYSLYDAPFSEAGVKKGLRGVIDAHYGRKTNPWCIISRDGTKYIPHPASTLGPNRQGNIRVAVDRRTGKVVALENPSEAVEGITPWQSLENRSYATINDAVNARKFVYGDPRAPKPMIGVERGADGMLHPVYNGRKIGQRDIRSVQSFDEIGNFDGVELL